MNSNIRKILLSSFAIILVMISFSTVGAADYDSEWEEVMAASNRMDADMQQRMMASSSPLLASDFDLSTQDLESLLLAIQSERTRLLDAQLKEQVEEVQKRNEKFAKLNNQIDILNQYRNKFQTDGKLLDNESSISVDDIKNVSDFTLFEWLHGANRHHVTLDDILREIQRHQAAIDQLTNSQQMDMLRLQSLTNKRNEAFETMTNFVKKMQDSRNSIISNMR